MSLVFNVVHVVGTTELILDQKPTPTRTVHITAGSITDTRVKCLDRVGTTIHKSTCHYVTVFYHF